MKNKHQFHILISLWTMLFPIIVIANTEQLLSDEIPFEDSLVYIESAVQKQSVYQPWKTEELKSKSFYGCAVSEYTILTTAQGVVDANFIKIKCKQSTQFIPVSITFIDINNNLCLLSCEPSSLPAPFKPISFSSDFNVGQPVEFYWFNRDAKSFKGRAIADDVMIKPSALSFNNQINYVVSNSSRQAGKSQLFCQKNKPIGLATWTNENNECGLIPAPVINLFLEDCLDGVFNGSASLGFASKSLIDPAHRSHLQLPKSTTHGVYISEIYSAGTGSKDLKPEDVLLEINNIKIDAYGRYIDSQYGEIGFEYLITNNPINISIPIKVWRNNNIIELHIMTETLNQTDMAIPFHQYNQRPEYMILGGLMFQTLTRPYINVWGEDESSRVSPYLYQYYKKMAFNPTKDRKEIVILSYVIPAQINLGYHKLRQVVLKSINGMSIRSLDDLPKAISLNKESDFITFEFENDNPVIVLPREQLSQADNEISQRYGINQLSYFRP